MEPGPILLERGHFQLEDITAENGAWPHLFSRLRSPFLRRGTMPAQPFSRFFHHTALAKQGTRRRRASRGSGIIIRNAIRAEWGKTSSPMVRPDPGELRRRREERMENGVKNLKGAMLFPKTFSNHGFRDASFPCFQSSLSDIRSTSKAAVQEKLSAPSPSPVRGL